MQLNLLPSISAKFLERLLRELDVPPFEIRFSERKTVSSRPGQEPRFRVTLRDPSVMTRILSNTDFKSLGEAYLRGDFDLDGDLEAIFPVAEALGERFPSPDDRDQAAVEIGYQSNGSAPHQPARDRDAVQYHYDLSNRVYRLITGPSLSYSCAYYESPRDHVDAAQERKFERVCAKLRVADGERLLDVGCGWGTMMRHAALRNRVDVTGITVSTQQALAARQVLTKGGLDERTRVLERDYRDVDEGAPFDKILSLGMVEHVGVQNLQLYFEKMYRLLRPGGLFLCQGVGSYPCEEDTRASAFAQNYQFPDAEMPYLTQYIGAAQAAGLEVRDVENMREHYALTHRAWGRNLKANREEILAEIGEERYRALELLYAYSPHYFLKRNCGVFQFLLYRPAGTGILEPMVRVA